MENTENAEYAEYTKGSAWIESLEGIDEPVPWEVEEQFLIREAAIGEEMTIRGLERRGYVVTRPDDRLRRASHSPEPHGTDAPVQRLAEALGYDAKKVYRLLSSDLIPGANKTDPRKPKSHYVIPDPEESARRFLAGERKAA